MSIYGSDKIYALLVANSTLTALLDTFAGSPAIFDDPVIPDSFTGNEVINLYRATPVDNTLSYTDALFTVNCRGKKKTTAESIQTAVKNALNRKNPLSGRGILITSALPTIPPRDERDDYNAPVEVRIKYT